MTESRYYQPRDSKDAMRYVENLFNQYKDAPLTDELVAYNQKLVYYLKTNVAPEALKEGQAQREKSALGMAEILTQWLHTRLSGQPFKGKMRGFKMQKNQSTHYHVDQGRRKNRQPTIRKSMHK